jgi:hypothetical protein
MTLKLGEKPKLDANIIVYIVPCVVISKASGIDWWSSHIV